MEAVIDNIRYTIQGFDICDDIQRLVEIHIQHLQTLKITVIDHTAVICHNEIKFYLIF